MTYSHTWQIDVGVFGARVEKLGVVVVRPIGRWVQTQANKQRVVCGTWRAWRVCCTAGGCGCRRSGGGRRRHRCCDIGAADCAERRRVEIVDALDRRRVERRGGRDDEADRVGVVRIDHVRIRVESEQSCHHQHVQDLCTYSYTCQTYVK